ncbi:GCN5-like N-acetyltransferase [Planococcus antarcticus DSM 14505]|uniref:Lipid II:glycine glycyltransferase n=1 Tax=Planococcus antarcticus DSM 14505 TaxID=1185653 RepID=A0A1C7DFF5_9BACL|nr:GNAT family N-acetyltransferase [Planococcus antarcticus]ANU10158.1 GNAT family N-acetyltransferase [Planococcus antarcticus DSM 14505]EIM06106.1 GCN5-like N-acetyltransferase [Planococcus antarcticus DSM 14505]
MKDIYFEIDYGRLYEKIENGKCEEFIFKHELGTVRHLFIKREIPIKLDGEGFYDLVTPYGYGGPRIVSGMDEDRAELVASFQQAFGEYCLEKGIVSELVRFHPVIKNHLDFSSCYDLSFKRKTIQTRLSDVDDPILTEYSASCRRDIRHGLKAGVEYRITDHPQDLEDFKKLYTSTMQRNDAEAVYYFGDSYFQNCIDWLGDYLVVVEVTYEGNIIGMSLNFVCGDFVHVHLTGTLREFHQLSAAYILQYALALWGKDQGKQLIHHGGGRTGEPDDKLYLFKKKFGRNEELEYFTGKKIWNSAIYELLCQAANTPTDAERFPAYRTRESPVSIN